MIADGDELNFAITGEVLQKGIFKFALLRPPLDAGLLPDALLDDALLHVHATASGVMSLPLFIGQEKLRGLDTATAMVGEVAVPGGFIWQRSFTPG
jgi:hypothetical protein